MLDKLRQTESKSHPMDFVVVGLGNPGSDYAGTRHNAGFEVIDRLGKTLGVTYWKNEAGCQVAEASWHDQKLLLAKPMSYMNTSGGPVATLMKRRGLSPDQLIVIHDELDIPRHSLRVKNGGGFGGHRGLTSLGQKLGTRDWLRVRVGIGRPPEAMDPSEFVLARPRGDEAIDFAETLDWGAEAVLALIDDGFERTREKLHGSSRAVKSVRSN